MIPLQQFSSAIETKEDESFVSVGNNSSTELDVHRLCALRKQAATQYVDHLFSARHCGLSVC